MLGGRIKRPFVRQALYHCFPIKNTIENQFTAGNPAINFITISFPQKSFHLTT